MPAPITELLARLQRDHSQLGITLYEPASEATLLDFERQKGLRLPAAMRTFYHFCNGFESAEDLFRLIPLAEILANGSDRYLVAPHDFHLAEYFIYCDMWTLTVNPLDPEEYRIYHQEEKTITLTTSFTEFLETFLDRGVYGEGGLYDWLQLVRRQQLAALYLLLAEPQATTMHELDQLAEKIRQELDLHYDAESVKYLEGFIERTKGSIPAEQWPGLVNSLGAFLGRCIIVNFGGQWQHDPELGTGVAFNEKNIVFPFNKTSKQLDNGLGDSIYSFYTLIPAIYSRPALAASIPPPPPPRKPWYRFW